MPIYIFFFIPADVSAKFGTLLLLHVRCEIVVSCIFSIFYIQYIVKILFHLQVTEAYKEFPSPDAPIVCSMAISSDVLLTNSSLGMVQRGSPLSYQQPAATRRDSSFHVAPPRPSLPLHGYHLEPTACSFVTTEGEQRHLQCLQVSWDMAHKYESTTRDQSSCSV